MLKVESAQGVEGGASAPPLRKRSTAAAAGAAALYFAALLFLAAQSPPRRVGDGGEYFVMAMRLSRMEPPAVTREELEQARQELRRLGSGFEVAQIDYPDLVGPDGRQEFLHYWLYPFLVAPMMAVAQAMHWHPNWAFTLTNALLLSGALFLVASHAPAAAVAGFLSPIIWWVDKAHTEIFQFALLAVAAVTLQRSPALALVCYAMAGAQNAAIGVTFPLFALVVLRLSFSARTALMSLVGATIVASPFVYTWFRLARLSPMAEYAQFSVPTSGALASFVLEPNIGILANAPVYGIAAIAALWFASRRGMEKSRLWWWPAVIQLLLVIIWSQNPNANHGGTPGVNRWVLSLLALSLPWMAMLTRSSALALVTIAALWSIPAHLPIRPENYTQPTRLAQWMWNRGWLHVTPAEVFAERVSRREPATVPTGLPGCTAVLMSDLQWPLSCVPPATPVPQGCRGPGAMCYGLHAEGATRFIVASNNGFFHHPAVPSWPATGPLADSLRTLLQTVDATRQQWDVDRDGRWRERIHDADIEVVLRGGDTTVVYVARTGAAPSTAGLSGVTPYSLLPFAQLQRIPANATNIALVVR